MEHMEKFDPIKMVELLKVEEGDGSTELTLVFQDNKSIRVTIVDGKLASKVIAGD